jgi:hypothetical protein
MPPKKKTKTSPGPPLDTSLPSDCIGYLASFLSFKEVGRFQSTCSSIQQVQSVSEDLFKQLAFSMFSEQHMLAVNAHISVDRPWRERLKQQVMGKKKKPPRTNYSLKDYRIVISMNLPDLSSYYMRCDIDGELLNFGVSRCKLVSIVSRFRTLSNDPNPNRSIVIPFICESMFDPETSSFAKSLSSDQLDSLKEQKAMAVAESKEEGMTDASPRPELDAFLKMVDDYLPCYSLEDQCNIKQVISMDSIDVSFLDMTTGKMALAGTLKCQHGYKGSLYFADYGDFSPDSFRGDACVRGGLDGQFVIEGDDVIIKITSDVQIQEWPNEDWNEPMDLSKKDLCLLFESTLRN